MDFDIYQNAGPNGYGGKTTIQGNVRQSTGIPDGYFGINSIQGCVKDFYATSYDYGGRSSYNGNVRQFLSRPYMSTNTILTTSKK
jgi:hypothetical protein